MAWLRGSRKTGWRVEYRVAGRGSEIKPGTPYIKDHGDALAALRDFREKAAFKKAVNSHVLSSTTIPVVLEKWKAHQIKHGLVSEHHGAATIKTLTGLAAAREWSAIRDITKAAVKVWRSESKVGTVNALRLLKSVLNWVQIEEELPIDRTVLDVGKKEKRERKPRPNLLTDQEARSAWTRAFNIGGFRAGMAIEHLLLFPCRPIDVSRCKVSGWDSAAQVITYKKTKNGMDVSHWVPDLHAKRLDQLAAGREPNDFLFLDYCGRPWATPGGRAQALNSWYYTNVGKAIFVGRQRGIYCLKRYAMTKLNKAAGGDRQSVIMVSGHLSEEMVDIYAGTNIEAQKKILTTDSYRIAHSALVSTGVSTEPLGVIESDRQQAITDCNYSFADVRD